jgi:hypothetical protein
VECALEFYHRAITDFISVPKKRGAAKEVECQSAFHPTNWGGGCERLQPWSRQKIYSWTDVTEIDTICTQGRKGWNGIFVIDLRDGTIIDITGWPDRFVAAYPHIVKALEGHRFAFNSTRVDLRCNVPYIRFLVQPP